MARIRITKDRYTVDTLYQWDLNQALYIYGLSLSSVPEIHFTNSTMDRAIVRQATVNSSGVIIADIPNSLLQSATKIMVYICTYDGSAFKSLYKLDIPVKARNKPADYVITDNDGEIYSFKSLENLVNNAVDETNGKFAIMVTTLERQLADATDALMDKLSECEEELDAKIDVFTEEYGGIHDTVVEHIDANNPHNITKETVNLGNVVNERQYSVENPPPGPFYWSGDINCDKPTTIALPVAANWFFMAKLVSTCEYDIANDWDITDVGLGAGNAFLGIDLFSVTITLSEDKSSIIITPSVAPDIPDIGRYAYAHIELVAIPGPITKEVS